MELKELHREMYQFLLNTHEQSYLAIILEELFRSVHDNQVVISPDAREFTEVKFNMNVNLYNFLREYFELQITPKINREMVADFIKWVDGNYDIEMELETVTDDPDCNHRRSLRKVCYFFCEDHGTKEDAEDEECTVWNRDDGKDYDFGCTYATLEMFLSNWESFDQLIDEDGKYNFYIICVGCGLDNTPFEYTEEMVKEFLSQNPLYILTP